MVDEKHLEVGFIAHLVMPNLNQRALGVTSIIANQIRLSILETNLNTIYLRFERREIIKNSLFWIKLLHILMKCIIKYLQLTLK